MTAEIIHFYEEIRGEAEFRTRDDFPLQSRLKINGLSWRWDVTRPCLPAVPHCRGRSSDIGPAAYDSQIMTAPMRTSLIRVQQNQTLTGIIREIFSGTIVWEQLHEEQLHTSASHCMLHQPALPLKEANLYHVILTLLITSTILYLKMIFFNLKVVFEIHFWEKCFLFSRWPRNYSCHVVSNIKWSCHGDGSYISMAT